MKHDHFYGGLPKRLKAMVAYLKASPQEKTYSNYLQAMREAKKEDSMEPSQSQDCQQYSKTQGNQFLPLEEVKGDSAWKMPAVGHIWKRRVKDEVVDNEDPDSIEGVTEEFMVHLARAMKDTQNKEKCCYHCSSLNHFIHDCPLVKALRTDSHLNCKEGQVLKKGAWAPQMKVTMPMTPPGGVPKA